jgi:protein BUR2
LFLSTKVEENTRKLRDIVNACAQKAQKNEKLQLSEDSKVSFDTICYDSYAWYTMIDQTDSQDFQKWKNTILFGEGIVLEAMCFDMSILHPHTCLIQFSSEIDGNASIQFYSAY